jgi:hypothetical protein
MTLDEFLMALEARMNADLETQARNPRFSLMGDGIIIHGLPPDHTTPFEGTWWNLNGGSYLLKIKLTHKAHLAWKCSRFDRLIPQEGESDWFDFDRENSVVTIRLHSH